MTVYRRFRSEHRRCRAHRYAGHRLPRRRGRAAPGNAGFRRSDSVNTKERLRDFPGAVSVPTCYVTGYAPWLSLWESCHRSTDTLHEPFFCTIWHIKSARCQWHRADFQLLKDFGTTSNQSFFALSAFFAALAFALASCAFLASALAASVAVSLEEIAHFSSSIRT